MTGSPELLRELFAKKHDTRFFCDYPYTSAESQERMGRGADIQWEAPFGTMMPAYYALYAHAYMAKHGVTHDDLMKVRIKASTYGTINDRAVYRKPVKPEDFKQGDPEAKMAGPVAWPLRVGDCCANADGSSCIILANAEKAKAMTKKPVWVVGIGSASEAVNMAARPDFTKGLSVGYAAAAEAYKMAGITAKDVKVAEVHDCFTISQVAPERFPRIAIVDDAVDARLLVRRILQSQGDYTTFEASNGREGLELSRRELPDLIILDLMMPEMDGFAVLDGLRAEPSTSRIPVIVATAKELTAHEKARLGTHIQSLLQKGDFLSDEFLEEVKALIK